MVRKRVHFHYGELKCLVRTHERSNSGGDIDFEMVLFEENNTSVHVPRECYHLQRIRWTINF